MIKGKIYSKRLFKAVLISTILSLMIPPLANATEVLQVKEHHPPSDFRDPSDTIDGYVPGDEILFHLHLNVTVGGGSNDILSIRSLNVTDNLPLGLTYVPGSESTTMGIPYTFSQLGQQLIWRFGNVVIDDLQGDDWQVGVSFNATVDMNVSDDEYLINSFTTEYYETVSGAFSNPTTTDSVWTARPILDIMKECLGTIYEGDSFSYVVTLTNTGNYNATVEVTDTIPSGVIYDPGDAYASSGTIIVDNPAQVVWSGVIGNVTSLNTVTLTIPVKDDPFDPTDPLVNTVSYTDIPEYAEVIKDTDECNTNVLHPDIALIKTCSLSSPTEPSTITYTYRVTNTGNTVLHDVVVYDQTLSIMILGPVVLNPGEFNQDTHVIPNLPAGTYSNIAEATGLDPNDLTVTDEDSAECTIQTLIIGGEVSRTPLEDIPPMVAQGLAVIVAALGYLFFTSRVK